MKAVRERRSALFTHPSVYGECRRAVVSRSPGFHSPHARTRPPSLSTPPPIVCYLRNPSITIELIGIPINISIEI